MGLWGRVKSAVSKASSKVKSFGKSPTAKASTGIQFKAPAPSTTHVSSTLSTTGRAPTYYGGGSSGGGSSGGGGSSSSSLSNVPASLGGTQAPSPLEQFNSVPKITPQQIAIAQQQKQKQNQFQKDISLSKLPPSQQFQKVARFGRTKQPLQLQPQISSAKIKEQQFQQGQQRATTFLLGGGKQPEVVIDERTEKPFGVVKVVEKPKGFLEGLNFELSKIRGATYQRQKPGIKKEVIGFGLGVGVSLIGTAQFGKGLVTKPVKTLEDVYVGAKSFVKDPKSYGKQAGEILRTQPGFATGFIATEYGTMKGISKVPKGITKVSDIYRTKKLIKVPITDVVAPEYFKGQTYPAIRKGQTAGELLKEFQPVKQYGVTRLTGFTASPRPFAKGSIAGAGSSELPGVYQAPKVSPKFLRVASETDKKIFTLSPFETLRPSVVKITPTKFELAKGVKPSQTKLATLKEVIPSFKESKVGKSIVPFIKTEKEAIIPAGTKLQLADKRFFFEFEGRKIPIYEFETLSGGQALKESMDVSKAVSSYSRSVSKSGVISSSDVLTSGKYALYPLTQPSVSYSVVPSSSKVYSIVSSPLVSISKGYVSSSREGYTPSKPIVPSQSITPSISTSIIPPSYRPLISKPSKVPYISKVPPSYEPPYPLIKQPPIPKIPKTIYKPKPYKQPKVSRRGFRVLGRRFGKWKQVGIAKDPLGAIGIGKQWARKTLGVTFRVPKYKGTKVKGFRTKKEKEGYVFIEPAKRRIKKKGTSKEFSELEYWKKVKSPITKKKVKGGKK